MKTKITLLMVAGLALLFSACSKEESVVDATEAFEKSGITAATLCTGCTYDGELTEADITGLMAMREEEKLAHDVYVTFYGVFGEDIFDKISESELTHAGAILNLINGYGLTDPAVEGFGNFNDPVFGDLFSSLTAKGSDLIAALAVGAEIEELDIQDLMELIAATENEDIQLVYGNLLSGSESHLRAFVKVLANLGVTYDNTILGDELYATILAGQQGKKGQGNGTNSGSGNQYKGANGKGQNGTSSSNGTGTCDGTQTGTQTGTGTTAQNGNSGSAGNSNGKGK